MLTSYSKARRISKSSPLMFAGHDGRTGDAEHQRWQRWHIYVIYAPPRDRYAPFAMPAMFGALAAEIWWLPISSHDSGVPGDGMFASQALPHLLIPGFLHMTLLGIGLGATFFAYSICWKCREHAYVFTTKLLPIGSLGWLNIQQYY